MINNISISKLLLVLMCVTFVCCGGGSDDSPKLESPSEGNGNTGGEEPTVVNELKIPTSGYMSEVSYAGMSEVWVDEFNGADLDTSKWNFQIGDACDLGYCGWGNNELEYYRKENTSLQNGYLVIEAKEEYFGKRDYTSSRINTTGKFAFKYGRVDVRASLPEGQGIWPAFWMMGENKNTVGWPACGEIDIMEMIGGEGRENTSHGTVHWDDGGHKYSGGHKKLTNGTFNDKFYVFSIVWTAESITWFIDDVQFHVIDITPDHMTEFHKDFHFLINLAVGGNWPGNPDATTTFSQYLIVDYIRVFQES